MSAEVAVCSLAVTAPVKPRAVQRLRVNTESDHPSTIEAVRIFPSCEALIPRSVNLKSADANILTGITLDSGPDSLQERYYPQKEFSD